MHLVRKEVQFFLPHYFQFSKNFEYKIDHISKMKIKIDFPFYSQHCASFRQKKKAHNLDNFLIILIRKSTISRKNKYK